MILSSIKQLSWFIEDDNLSNTSIIHDKSIIGLISGNFGLFIKAKELKPYILLMVNTLTVIYDIDYICHDDSIFLTLINHENNSSLLNTIDKLSKHLYFKDELRLSFQEALIRHHNTHKEIFEEYIDITFVLKNDIMDISLFDTVFYNKHSLLTSYFNDSVGIMDTFSNIFQALYIIKISKAYKTVRNIKLLRHDILLVTKRLEDFDNYYLIKSI